MSETGFFVYVFWDEREIHIWSISNHFLSTQWHYSGKYGYFVISLTFFVVMKEFFNWLKNCLCTVLISESDMTDNIKEYIVQMENPVSDGCMSKTGFWG